MQIVIKGLLTEIKLFILNKVRSKEGEIMKIEKENSTTINVLILSDRLIDNAQKLSNYLTLAGIQVIALTTTKEQALKFCNEKIDFLIIVGYLEDRQNYGIIEEFKVQKNSCIAVQWAILDGLIKIYCNQYKIPLQFDRTLPMSDFVTFLEQNHALNITTGEREEKCNSRKSFFVLESSIKGNKLNT
jgi:hypothetical protein